MPDWSLSEVFVCALKLSSRLNERSPTFPRDVAMLIDDVKEHLQATKGFYVPIEIHPRAYNASAFIGTVEVKERSVEIFYDVEQNACWKRFIITKELCQVLYDTPNSQHLTSTKEQIGSLLTQILAGLTELDVNDHAASSEQATILMAIEILLPHSERDRVLKLMEKGATKRQIAQMYRLPEQFVSYYLERSYAASMEKATKLFQEPDAKKAT